MTTDAAGDVIPIITDGNTTDGSPTTSAAGSSASCPTAPLNTFAYGFDTNGAQDSSSFVNSMLSISFSADGTTLYASDDAGDLAVQDDGRPGRLDERNPGRAERPAHAGRALRRSEGSAVAVVDTGVDASSPPFRGRVAPGTNIFTGGLGNDDTGSSTTRRPALPAAAAAAAGGDQRSGQFRSTATARRWPA